MVLSQILWFELKRALHRSSLNYISFDEGTRYYVTEGKKDLLLKLIYPFITFIMLKFPLRYYNRLGTHSEIDYSLIRFPEYLPGKQKNTTYIKLKAGVSPSSYSIPSNNPENLLIISSPFSEDGILSIGQERLMWQKVMQFTKNLPVTKIYVKLHPRENDSKFSSFKNLHFIERSICMEDIDPMSFLYIINFGSSAIIELINYFDPKCIYTIEIDQFPIKFLRLLFEKTHLLNLNDLSE